MQITPLTTSEEHLMKLLWKLKTFYMKDVLEQHPDPKPHQNTVSTYLKILVEKGFLATEKEGRIYKYSVAVPFEDYKKFVLKDLLERFYENSGNEILKFLFDEKMISQQDLMSYFNLKIEMKQNEATPVYEIATSILKKKGKKDKKKKKK